MQEFAKSFYRSKAWQHCRDGYAKAAGGLCEECLRRGIYQPGEIVHHRQPITPENIDDPTVTLSWDNLELVCRDCHAELHRGCYGRQKRRRRYRLDALGRVTI